MRGYRAWSCAFLFSLLAYAHAPASALAEEGRISFQNGHNLTYTSDLLTPGQCVIGIAVSACGVAPRLSVGVSPWMHLDYRMLSVALRALLEEDADGNRWATQANYFRSYRPRQRPGEYQMEALWLMAIRTWRVSEQYRLHANLQANYYFDETLPFSLRRPYMTETPFQFNVSLLHQIALTEHFFLFGEMGLLDFARAPVHLHGGASIGGYLGNFSARVGFSLTGTPNGLFSPLGRVDYQQVLRASSRGYASQRDPTSVRYDYGIHPEFSAQYAF